MTRYFHTILASIALVSLGGIRADANSADWIAAPRPPYPLISALHRTGGEVALRLILRKDGWVKEVVVVQTSGSERLDAAARMAALKWRLNPAKLRPSDMREGRTVLIEFKKEERTDEIARAVLLEAGRRGSAWQIKGVIQYPTLARAHHQEGSLLLRFTIGFNGHPDAVVLLKSSGYPSLDQAAMAGIKTWKAYPQFVGESVNIPIDFEL
jgi:TonB family protein